MEDILAVCIFRGECAFCVEYEYANVGALLVIRSRGAVLFILSGGGEESEEFKNVLCGIDSGDGGNDIGVTFFLPWNNARKFYIRNQISLYGHRSVGGCSISRGK